MRLVKNSIFYILAGLMRCAILNIFYRNKFTSGFLVVVGARVSIFITGSGAVRIGRRAVISDDVEVQAAGAPIAIGPGTTINRHSRIVAFQGISIGSGCAIAQYVSILDHDHARESVDKEPSEYVTAPIRIGDNVWIGDKVTILKGVTIGDNVTIGAGTVVTKNIPRDHTVVGAPNRTIRVGRVFGVGA